MRKGQLPKGIGVLLAGDRETDAGRCHCLGSDFSYEEAAAQRYILWPNHIAGWDELNASRVFDAKPSAFSFRCFAGTRGREAKGLVRGGFPGLPRE